MLSGLGRSGARSDGLRQSRFGLFAISDDDMTVIAAATQVQLSNAQQRKADIDSGAL
jgi:hypothetical protein